MKKKYQIPTIEINGVLPTTLLAGSGQTSGLIDSLVGKDGDSDNNILDPTIGAGDGTGASTPRSNGSALWDKF